MSRIGISIEMESRLVVARGSSAWHWGLNANGYGVSFCSDENILELESGKKNCQDLMVNLCYNFIIASF